MGQSCALLLTSFSFTLVTPDASGRRTKADKLFFFFSLLCAGMKSFVLEFSSKACSLKDLTHAFVVVHYFSSHLPGNRERLFFLFEIDR